MSDHGRSEVADAYRRADELEEAARRLLADTPAPRSTRMLLDVAERAGISASSTVLDAGCRDGKWSRWLIDRFGCHVIGVDLVPTRRGQPAALPVVGADMTVLPIATSAVAARVPGTTTKDLMARIGHASAQAALRYQHATEAADRAMSAGVDGAIRATREPDEKGMWTGTDAP